MNKVLCLRTCDAQRRGHGGFQWPESGYVEAPDWSPEPCCGRGLHGLLWGEGEAFHLSAADDAVWLVVSVEATDIVDLDGKVKFPRGEVVYCGDRDGAVAYILANGGAGKACAYARAPAGAYGAATAGEGGTATAGYSGTATAGDYGVATAGAYGTATAGDYGTATAGYSGTATAGAYGAATAGDYGTATAGYKGTATAGEGGTATAGDYGTATAGDYGTVCIRWYDGAAARYRTAVGYVGEDGIESNVPYRVEGRGKLVRA